MANLIITVISIALVAIAALMGAYYGGQAFMDGQIKAKIDEISNAFSQVDAATQMYLLDGNAYPYDQYGNSIPASTLLVPKYLATAPHPGFAGYISGEVDFRAYGGKKLLWIYLDSEKVCKQIEFLRTGTIPTNLNTLFSVEPFDGKFGCMSDYLGQVNGLATPLYIAYFFPR